MIFSAGPRTSSFGEKSDRRTSFESSSPKRKLSSANGSARSSFTSSLSSSPSTSRRGSDFEELFKVATSGIQSGVGEDCDVYIAGIFNKPRSEYLGAMASSKTVSTLSKMGERRAVALACGSNHVATIDRQGQLQLEKPSSELEYLDGFEVLNSKQRRFVGVACGSEHVVAWTETQVYSWGKNDKGQLGHEKKSAQPIQSIEGRVIQVAAHGCYSLVLMDDGSVFGFGSGCRVKLVNYEVERIQIDVPVDMVAVGGAHCIAVTSSGQVSLPPPLFFFFFVFFFFFLLFLVSCFHCRSGFWLGK